MKRNHSITGLIILMLGVLFLGYGLYLPFQPKSMIAQENIGIIKEGITTTGEIVSLRKTMQKDPGKESEEGSPARLYEVAKVKYSVKGSNYEVTGSRLLQSNGWDKKDSISVVYDISEPRKAVINEDGVPGVDKHPYLPALFLIGGILACALGIILSLRKSIVK